MGGAGWRRSVGAAKSAAWTHFGAADRARRQRVVPGLCVGPGCRGARGHAQRHGRQDVRRAADRVRLPALLGIAALAAVLANVVNNLPATLVLVPLVAAGGPAAVLAVLLGVNIGPNLTYAGSLSNLLWRGVLRRHNVDASVGEYTRLGLCTVPAALAMAVLALWASAQVLGI